MSAISTLAPLIKAASGTANQELAQIASPNQPQGGRGVLRVAAETIEAVAHQPVGPAIGIAEAKVEIAAHGETEANKEQRQANQITARIEQARAIPIQ